MKNIKLFPQDINEIKEGDHLNDIHHLFEGSIIKTSQKAVLVEYLNGQHVNPTSKIWIPKSIITICGGWEYIGENASETPYNRNLDVSISDWWHYKNFRK